MNKFEQILFYPLRIFRNNIVLKITILSVLIMFVLLSLTNVTFSINEKLFEENKVLYGTLKYLLYQFIEISVLGYFVSKYKFCYWTVLAFYGIIYMRIFWYINEYIYEVPNYMIKINAGILIVWLIAIVYYFIKQYNLMRNIK